MAIYNLGSINADNFYSVPHIPVAGETLAADRLTRGLGGKGTNMSVAAARAAARVFHIGAVGQDGRWAQTRLLEYGVDVTHIAISNLATGHANICVAPDGENQIVLFAGANHTISKDQIGTALSGADNGDFLVLQNETNAQTHAAEMGARLGLRVAYAAAPFDTAAVQAVLPYIEFLFLNAVEAAQLEAALGMALDELPVRHVIVTLGADGCRWIDTVKGKTRHFAAFPVTPVDTTGAGDTFTGYVVAGVDRGQPIAQAIQTAIVAAAIMVTRRGTADVIPDLKDVQEARGAS